MPKRLIGYWSKMAYEAAGKSFPALHAQVMEEAAEIVAQTHDWFVHVVEIEEDAERILYCRGQEGEDAWAVIVQLGAFQPLEAEPDEEPLPEIAGMTPSMPVALPGEDNERFGEIG